MPKTDTNANGHSCICCWFCRVLGKRGWCNCPICHSEHSTEGQRTKRSRSGHSNDVNKANWLKEQLPYYLYSIFNFLWNLFLWPITQSITIFTFLELLICNLPKGFNFCNKFCILKHSEMCWHCIVQVKL